MIFGWLLLSTCKYSSLQEDIICCRAIQYAELTLNSPIYNTSCSDFSKCLQHDSKCLQHDSKCLQHDSKCLQHDSNGFLQNSIVLQEAQQFLIQKYAGFVGSVVKSLHVKRQHYWELYADGVSGLLLAARRYDGNRGYLLSTYAKMYIMDAVHRGKTRLLPGNLLTHYQVMARHRIRKKRYLLREELGRTPTVAELAYILPYSEEMIKQLLNSDASRYMVLSELPTDKP